ncbi:hypothetical protein HG537_0C01290 [Torulaspora globosa]|uniref:Uncharacterized protein n=1 Tax=Torulaspora globosa TaxID=48254 RepID=A0A7H9HSZ7_9SACH|nr:hypothetical protein HG537_0C01290 [Torulaspora sp. CBS 2947]
MKNCLIGFIITLFSICSLGRCYAVWSNVTIEQFVNISIVDVSGEALEILTDGFDVVADLTVYQVVYMLYTSTPYVLDDSVVFLDNEGNVLATGGANIEGDPNDQSIRFTLTEAQADAENQELYIYDELEQDISQLMTEAYSSLSNGDVLERRSNPLNNLCGFNLNNNSCRSYQDCNRGTGNGKKCGCLRTDQAKLCLTYKP